MIKDLVSIGMSSFNNQETISRAIESVKNQTYKKWELIIVDANSRDQTTHIIRAYAKRVKGIRFIFKDYQSRWTENTLLELSLANGEYFFFLDSDDYLSSNYIESLVNLIKKNNISCAAAQLSLINSRNEYVISNPSHGMIFKFTNSKYRMIRVLGALFAPESLGLVNSLYGVWSIEQLQKIKLWQPLENRGNFDQEFLLNVLKFSKVQYSENTTLYRSISQEGNYELNRFRKKTGLLNNLLCRNISLFCKYIDQLFKSPPPLRLHLRWILNNLSIFSPIYVAVLLLRICLSVSYFFINKTLKLIKLEIKKLLHFLKK